MTATSDGRGGRGGRGGRPTLLAMLRSPRALVGGADPTPMVLLFAHAFIDAAETAGFAVLLPSIKASFNLSLNTIATVGGLSAVMALIAGVAVARQSDKTHHRVLYLSGGAAVFAVFAIGSGLAPNVALLVLARLGAGLGIQLTAPVQQSLLADYYAVETRAATYPGREIARNAGLVIGPAVYGLIGAFGDWRLATVVTAVPALLLAVASLRLREPARGEPERAAMGITGDDLSVEADAPDVEESIAILKNIGTVRRLWASLPFLVGGVLALGILMPLYAEEVFGFGSAARGFSAAAGSAAAMLGAAAGIPLAARYLSGNRHEEFFRLLQVSGFVSAACLLVVVVAPTALVYVIGLLLLSAVGAVLTPGFAVLSSLVLPPRARTVGFAVTALWALPGLLVLPIATSVGQDHGLRIGLSLAMPMFIIGGLLIGSGGKRFAGDVQNALRASMAALEEKQARAANEASLLICRGVDLSYGQVQVLFGVDFDVKDGEIVALLGTNGAGKSSLLRAISGTSQPSAGTILFDGRDITNASGTRTAELGVVQVPGGRGVFPTLTVGENLRVASWLYRKDDDYLDSALDRVLSLFPVLAERFDQPAANLSGGEQQMLTLAQAFVARPRLLLIDELSLGLAPAIVQQLLEVVKAIHAQGVTVVVVEQSVNVALTIADRAVFLEKGEVRFEGRTSDLLDRPDVLRSVFLAGATAPSDQEPPAPAPLSPGARISSVSRARRLPPILEVRDLDKSFGGVRAVQGVSFAVRPGETLGLIGSNGAGKTTVFDLVSGFLAPDRGQIIFDGDDISWWTPHERSRARLGRSFQDARMFPSMTVSDTIAVSLERHIQVRDPFSPAMRVPVALDEERAIRRRVDELIELMGLGAYADKLVSELSTGTRRVVDLTCTMAHQPRVLLLDEPSSGIAQRETEALGPLLRRVQAETGCSLLVIEHDMPLISSVSDDLVCLEAGVVIAEGSPEEVLSNSRVIASYLGTDPAAIERSGAAATRPRPRVRLERPLVAAGRRRPSRDQTNADN